MRPGLLEIGVVILIVLIIYAATRVSRGGDNDAKKAKEQQDNGKAGGRGKPRLKIAGIALLVIGVIILIASFSLVKWIFWGNVWAFIILAIGLVLLFLTRRR